MPDTIIVGGGLCGLALAKSLQERGRDFMLYEARERMGGRIFSERCQRNNLAVDLGPTWFWPDTQPRVTRLISDLGLDTFAQHDQGGILRLNTPDEKPEVMALTDIHGGARRVIGGMGRLVTAMTAQLPVDRLHLGHTLLSVEEDDDYVILSFRHNERVVQVNARHVVLALPPRLLEEHVLFDPPLNASLREAMRATHTWMADQAKVVVAYDQAFWRESGQSGNAFVTHEQVVLPEIFDACDATGEQAALGAFFSLPPALRATIPPATMALLISSQLVQVFDPPAEDGEQHVHDWAQEAYTCSTLDRTPPSTHPEYGNPNLRLPLWENKLFFGGSETAGYGGGYLEGALESAARLQRMLAPDPVSLSPQALNGPADNTACIALFGTWVTAQQPDLLATYRRHLNQYLTRQHKEQLTQRALLDTMEQFYSEALRQLSELPFDTSGTGIHKGRSDLTPEVHAPFATVHQTLIREALAFNRSSCALSNFPEEHEPGKEYLSTIARDLAAAWREFALSSNAVLLAKAAPVTESQRTH
ncbi:MAG: flavin monoamine oxidase family protein [Acidithiobacillus ferriphilus]